MRSNGHSQVFEMRHMIGNIGKPGIGLMLPPVALMHKKVESNPQVMVNYAPSDRHQDDGFQERSHFIHERSVSNHISTRPAKH